MTAHVATNYYSGTGVQGSGVQTFTVNVDVGTGTNRAVLVTLNRRHDRAPVLNSITIGGESVTLVGSDVVNPASTSRSAHGGVLLNPTVTGTQSLVATCTTSGSNSDFLLIVAVYDDVDPAATPADLLTGTGTDLEQTPWTGTANFDITSVTGELAVLSVLLMSSDAGWTMTFSGATSRLNATGGGFGRIGADAAGAATVSVSWVYSALSLDCGATIFGWSLPAPSAGGDVAAAGSLSITGAAVLNAAGSLAAAGAASITGAAILRAAGSLLAAGSISIAGAADLDARGTLAAAGAVSITGAADIRSAGVLSSVGSISITGAADLDAVGSLAAAGAVSITGAADLTSTAVEDIAATGALSITGSADLDATGTLASAGSATITGAADLTSSTNEDIAAVGSLTITGAAALRALGSLTAAGALSITGAANLIDAGSNFAVYVWERTA